jgi:hypothetical protein
MFLMDFNLIYERELGAAAVSGSSPEVGENKEEVMGSSPWASTVGTAAE